MMIRLSATCAAFTLAAAGADAFVAHSKAFRPTVQHQSLTPSISSWSTSNSNLVKLFSSSESAEDVAEDKDKDIAPLESIELTDEKIAEILEVTFIKACLQLATGYVDVLKLFLASTTAAYDRNIPIPQLIQSVADCPVNTANRELTKEEVNLRSDWIIISYLTMETMNRLEKKDVKDLSIPDDIRKLYGDIVEKKVKKSLGLVEEGNNGSEGDAAPSDPQAAAIYAYNMKVVELAISNIEEAKVANEAAPTIDEDGVGPPRPKIPGAY